MNEKKKRIVNRRIGKVVAKIRENYKNKRWGDSENNKFSPSKLKRNIIHLNAKILIQMQIIKFTPSNWSWLSKQLYTHRHHITIE